MAIRFLLALLPKASSRRDRSGRSGDRPPSTLASSAEVSLRDSEKALPREGMLDERFGVRLAESHAGGFAHGFRREKGRVDELRRQPCELRNPAPDVRALGI